MKRYIPKYREYVFIDSLPYPFLAQINFINKLPRGVKKTNTKKGEVWTKGMRFDGYCNLWTKICRIESKTHFGTGIGIIE